MTTKPKVISLFSGCGGMDLGFSQAGFEVVYANDIDKSVEATYQHNIGDIEIKDFSLVEKSGLPDADIIVAGIPCQPFSTAGKRLSTQDNRGQLFEEVMQVLVIKRPKIVIFENVRGFLSAKDENGITMPERIRKELNIVGYNLYYQLLNAADYEVPQNRHRVFLIGIRKDIDKGFYFPRKVALPKDCLNVDSVISKPIPNDEVIEHWGLSPQSVALLPYIPEGGSWKNVPYEQLPSRLKNIHDNMKKYRSPNFYRRFSRAEIMGTITAASTPENSGIIHPLENRRYSVREIARFQTFPDEFKFIGTTLNKKYKMIGNAVPVKLAYHIAKSILSQYFTEGYFYELNDRPSLFDWVAHRRWQSEQSEPVYQPSV
ncbi:MAG: DNA cytosine methyltransferase [Phototrophicales bacterium]|nr:DNA cytosine methyltransferase [Phototrophicales bacterium]